MQLHRKARRHILLDLPFVNSIFDLDLFFLSCKWEGMLIKLHIIQIAADHECKELLSPCLLYFYLKHFTSPLVRVSHIYFFSEVLLTLNTSLEFRS